MLEFALVNVKTLTQGDDWQAPNRDMVGRAERLFGQHYQQSRCAGGDHQEREHSPAKQKAQVDPGPGCFVHVHLRLGWWKVEISGTTISRNNGSGKPVSDKV